jgi:hypothetical protein
MQCTRRRQRPRRTRARCVREETTLTKLPFALANLSYSHTFLLSYLTYTSHMPTLPLPIGRIPRWPGDPALAFTRKWSHARLVGLRAVGDLEADLLITQLAAERGLRSMHDLLSTVHAIAGEDVAGASAGGCSSSSSTLPSRCRHFLATSAVKPPWLDRESVERGASIIAKFAPIMGLALFSGSLIGGGIFHNMALITGASGQLGGDNSGYVCGILHSIFDAPARLSGGV